MRVQSCMIVGAFGAGPFWMIIGVIVCTRVVIVAMIMVIMMVTLHVQGDRMEHGGQ